MGRRRGDCGVVLASRVCRRASRNSARLDSCYGHRFCCRWMGRFPPLVGVGCCGCVRGGGKPGRSAACCSSAQEGGPSAFAHTERTGELQPRIDGVRTQAVPAPAQLDDPSPHVKKPAFRRRPGLCYERIGALLDGAQNTAGHLQQGHDGDTE